MKHAIKEIGIFILLCLAVVIFLAVLLYNYNPSGKVVPSKVSYTAPETIKEELQEATEASQTTIKMEDRVYTIDGTDLNVYQKNKSYSSGNSNPFSDPTKATDENTTKGTTNSNGNTGNTSNTGTTNNNTPAAMSQTQINDNLTNGSGNTSSSNNSGSSTNSQPGKIK